MAVICTAGLWFAYSNHFDNDFHFDDSHTIVSNGHIRDWHNIPSYFTDATTTSSLPANQAYRPGLTTLNAIDFALAGEDQPEPQQFHTSIFASYVLLLVLLYLMLVKVFAHFSKERYFHHLLLLTTAFFGLHAANAETINYIIARSDSFSTLMVLAGLVWYQYSAVARRFQLFLIPVFIGFFVKEPTVMFAPLLALYVFLFRQDGSASDISIKGLPKLWASLKPAIPAFVLAAGLFLFSRAMTPAHWTPTTTSAWDYLITQPFVIVHYFNNFLLPVNLSADTDWTVLATWKDDRLFIGLGFLIALVAAALRLMKSPSTRPAAFGLLWFLIALFPTSSIFPLGEVLNDHRTFFPYIGLAIAAGNLAFAVLQRLPNAWRLVVPATMVLAIAGHGYGTYQRCEVWDSGESLWKDVAEKSPNNARGLMNYGNALMAQARYDEALEQYKRALELWPRYSYLYINLGVLYGATNKPELAEQHFIRATELSKNNPETWFYYGRWLNKVGRYAESKAKLEEALRVSPQHTKALALLPTVESNVRANSGETTPEDWEAAARAENTADAWLTLSLRYYRLNQFEDCIRAAQQALELRADYPAAYNNICSAYNALGQYEKAAEACKEGLKFAPQMELLQNNLKEAERNLSSK